MGAVCVLFGLKCLEVFARYLKWNSSGKSNGFDLGDVIGVCAGFGAGGAILIGLVLVFAANASRDKK